MTGRRRTLLLAPLVATLGTLGTLAAGCSSNEPVTAIVRIGPAPVEFRVEVAQTYDRALQVWDRQNRAAEAIEAARETIAAAGKEARALRDAAAQPEDRPS